MALTDSAVAGFITEVEHLIDLTRHHSQHAGVLVFDAQAQGFGAVHTVHYNWSNKLMQEKLWPEHASDLGHGRHRIFAFHVHLVLITKYRRN